jgi:hypothetical protein
LIRFGASCAALLAFSAVADATTLRARFAPLETALENARGSLPATHLSKTQRSQRAAIGASLKTLARDLPTLDAELAFSAKALLPLRRTKLLSDAQIGGASASMVSLFTEYDMMPRRAALAADIANLPAGSLQDKPNIALQAADRYLAAAQAATDSWAAVVDFGKALNAIEKGEKIVSKSKWIDFSADGAPLRVPGGHQGVKAVFGKYYGTWDLFGGAYHAPNGYDVYVEVLNVTGPGTFAANTSGTRYFVYRADGTGTTNWMASHGTVTFTTWDPDNHKCAGSIDIVMTTLPAGAGPDVTITGTFSDGDMVINLLVNR